MLGGAHIPEDELYAYVLGEGDAKSRAEFREHLRTCPQCSSEAAETQLALSALSLALPEAEPDLSVRRRVMQEISPAAGTNREARATFFGWRWAFGLAACAAVVFAVMAGGAWQRNHNLAAQLQDAQARNAGLQAAQAESANNSARAVAVLSALTAADTAKFVLTRADARPEPQVRAYYRRSTGQVLLTAAALPPLPNGKVYELWLLGEKSPRPAGTFTPDASGAVSLMGISLPHDLPVKGFGVTIEDDGGSPVPTPPVLYASK